MDDEPTGAAGEDATAAEGELGATSAADPQATSSEGADQPDPPTTGTSDDSGDSIPAAAVEREDDLRGGDGDESPAELAEQDGDLPVADGEPSPADEIIELPWDDDLPVALGEDAEVRNGRDDADADAEPVDEIDDGGDLPDEGYPDDEDGAADDDGDGDRTEAYFARRRMETKRGLDSWRSRSATGAIATAIAMGLQQVFEPEKRRPAAVAEAPSDPYSDDDPVTVEYVPDDAPATTVRVKPWLLQKGDPE